MSDSGAAFSGSGASVTDTTLTSPPPSPLAIALADPDGLLDRLLQGLLAGGRVVVAGQHDLRPAALFLAGEDDPEVALPLLAPAGVRPGLRDRLDEGVHGRPQLLGVLLGDGRRVRREPEERPEAGARAAAPGGAGAASPPPLLPDDCLMVTGAVVTVSPASLSFLTASSMAVVVLVRTSFTASADGSDTRTP